MDDGSVTPEGSVSAGAAMFTKLRALGVECVLVNSGTDFPPIIEGLAEAGAKGADLPQPLIIPHEHAAMGMAHGYYLATGKTPAVMLHTNVGLSNGVTGLINAATDNVPMLLMSGRTPVTEQNRFGARTVPIGWGQEMRDQTAMVREPCKWDYELRFPEQAPELLDRAHGIANSMPKGPVYMSLPREVLCEPCPSDGLDAPGSMRAAKAGPRAEDIAALADALASARNPVIFAQRGAGSAAGFAALSKMAEDWAIPVCPYWATALPVPSKHSMNVGPNPAPWLAEADVVLVIDSLAPWEPDSHQPAPGAMVAQMGPDPLFSRFPVRNFRADIAIACEVDEGIVALEDALRGRLGKADRDLIAARRKKVSKAATAYQSESMETALSGARSPMTKAYVGKCVSDAIQGYKATVLNELGAPLFSLDLKEHDSWRQLPHSGALGWSVPCAMGMKLGDPDRLVVATLGDGSYMFANPIVCHQVMEAYDLPVLSVVVNNAEWGAVRKSVQGMYPNGYAARANQIPLTALSPSPDFSRAAEASNGWARKTSDPDALPGLLEEAVRIVMVEKRSAMLDVTICD
jgi:acetolactate synthase I/II/III large subunit